jgi:ABC-2 type transport system permease protein
MNTPSSPSSNAMTEFRAESSGILSATRPFYWSVRKELWEYRSIYLAPASIAGVIVLGFIFVVLGLHIRLPHAPHSMSGQMQRYDAIFEPFGVAAALIMGAAFLVSFFYSLDCLYGERRDRSILFWKSLPVSDITVVLAKASVLFLVLPAVAFVATLVTEAILFLLSCTLLSSVGLSFAGFWAQLQPIQSIWGLLRHLVTVHILWYAPMYAWLILISAWSKRAPLLWAVLPPFAVIVFEKVAFHTAYFQNFLQNRFAGNTQTAGASMAMDQMAPHFLMEPGLWIGLLFAAGCLFTAARLRRARGPI